MIFVFSSRKLHHHEFYRVFAFHAWGATCSCLPGCGGICVPPMDTFINVSYRRFQIEVLCDTLYLKFIVLSMTNQEVWKGCFCVLFFKMNTILLCLFRCRFQPIRGQITYICNAAANVLANCSITTVTCSAQRGTERSSRHVETSHSYTYLYKIYEWITSPQVHR